MVDVAGNVFTSVTLASIITGGALTINLTQNFGNLANSKAIKTSGLALVGPYGNAETAFAAIVIGLGVLYLIYFFYGWWRMRHDKVKVVQKIYYFFILFAVILGIASAGMNLYLTENYINIGSLDTCPATPVAGENYSLCGPYGTGTFAMAIISTTFGSLGFFWMLAEIIRHWNVVSTFDVETVPNFHPKEKIE